MRLDLDATLGVTLAVLVGGAALVARLTRVTSPRTIVTAAVRAAVQLAAVSLVITAVVKSAGWTAAFVVFMFAVATATAARRIGRNRGTWWTALPIGAGALPVVGGLVLFGVVPSDGLTLVPIAGILIGGAMVATSLSGRRTLDELGQRHGEVEAALAVGLLERDARWEICGRVAGEALVPGLDQTRTVGLVTLPGAFVGMLLGGATPAEAGAVQLLVLVALLAVQVVAVAITAELVARGLLHR